MKLANKRTLIQFGIAALVIGAIIFTGEVLLKKKHKAEVENIKIEYKEAMDSLYNEVTMEKDSVYQASLTDIRALNENINSLTKEKNTLRQMYNSSSQKLSKLVYGAPITKVDTVVDSTKVVELNTELFNSYLQLADAYKTIDSLELDLTKHRIAKFFSEDGSVQLGAESSEDSTHVYSIVDDRIVLDIERKNKFLSKKDNYKVVANSKHAQTPINTSVIPNNKGLKVVVDTRTYKKATAVNK